MTKKQRKRIKNTAKGFKNRPDVSKVYENDLFNVYARDGVMEDDFLRELLFGAINVVNQVQSRH